MLTKKQILEAIDAMPEEQFTHIDAVIEELVLLEKIERGLDEMKRGEVISEEEVNKEVETMVKLQYSEPSRNDTKSIYNFIAFDPSYYAKKFIKEIKDKIKVLKTNP